WWLQRLCRCVAWRGPPYVPGWVAFRMVVGCSVRRREGWEVGVPGAGVGERREAVRGHRARDGRIGSTGGGCRPPGCRRGRKRGRVAPRHASRRSSTFDGLVIATFALRPGVPPGA